MDKLNQLETEVVARLGTLRKQLAEIQAHADNDPRLVLRFILQLTETLDEAEKRILLEIIAQNTGSKR